MLNPASHLTPYKYLGIEIYSLGDHIQGVSAAFSVINFAYLLMGHGSNEGVRFVPTRKAES